MAEKKHIAFAILDILTTYTDEDHILTAKEIMDLLKAKYNIEIERWTIYSNIDVLEQAGYVISKFDDNGKVLYASRNSPNIAIRIHQFVQ